MFAVGIKIIGDHDTLFIEEILASVDGHKTGIHSSIGSGRIAGVEMIPLAS